MRKHKSEVAYDDCESAHFDSGRDVVRAGLWPRLLGRFGKGQERRWILFRGDFLHTGHCSSCIDRPSGKT